MNATRTTAWQCIGCGRLESDATCLGICQDRKVVRQLALTSARGNDRGA